jgi:hypothetical protein
VSKSPSESINRPIVAHDRGMLLTGLALVLFRTEVILGRRGGRSHDLSFFSRLRTQHVRIGRDADTYYIESPANAEVSVRGQSLKGRQCLEERDEIVLGQDAVAFRFFRPVATSGTAVLELDQKSASAISLRGVRDITRVILMQDQIRIAPRGPAHVLVPNLPCDAIELRWCDDMLVATLERGTWRLHGELDCSPRTLNFFNALSVFRHSTQSTTSFQETFLCDLLASFSAHTPADAMSWMLLDPYSYSE